eukprot:9476570-Pyramimonas_sp.AAC.4
MLNDVRISNTSDDVSDAAAMLPSRHWRIQFSRQFFTDAIYVRVEPHHARGGSERAVAQRRVGHLWQIRSPVAEYKSRAATYRALGRLDDAIKDLGRALSIAPYDTAAMLAQGQVRPYRQYRQYR